jgi:hypothetical protein
MNEYLTKPLDKKLLLSMVHKCATTTPVLHPNLNRIIEITPDSEIGNPLDNTNKSSPGTREVRRNSVSTYQDHSDGRLPMSRGSLLRGT